LDAAVEKDPPVAVAEADDPLILREANASRFGGDIFDFIFAPMDCCFIKACRSIKNRAARFTFPKSYDII
jgi:hypothetical protein